MMPYGGPPGQFNASGVAGRASVRPRHLLAQLLHSVTQIGGFLKIELLGRLLHLGLKLIDQLRQRLQRQACLLYTSPSPRDRG